jgi:hypothetical protein
LLRSTRVFDSAGEEVIPVKRKKTFKMPIFQLQISVIFILLLYSGAVSGGLEKVLRPAQFIADIYQQFPHSCIFTINPEAQQQGED